MPTGFTDIAIECAGHVCIVDIQRPPHNYFDVSLIHQIGCAFERAEQEKSVRCIVLASQGTSFCAGANFGSQQAGHSSAGGLTQDDFWSGMEELYEEAAKLFRFLKPIVAAVQGPAIGGGLGLALVADFRVATPQSRFAANFVKLGIHPGFGLTVTLPRLIGHQEASRLFLTGVRIKGEDALKLGLVDEVVPQDSIRSRALEFAEEISGNAPLAVVSTRATLRQGLAQEVEARMRHELEEQRRLRHSADAREGIRAVAERRLGVFVGA